MDQELCKSSSEAWFSPVAERISAAALDIFSSKAVSPTKKPWWFIHTTSVWFCSCLVLLWSNRMMLEKMWPQHRNEALAMKGPFNHLCASLDYEMDKMKDYTWVLLLESFDKDGLSFWSVRGIVGHVEMLAIITVWGWHISIWTGIRDQEIILWWGCTSYCAAVSCGHHFCVHFGRVACVDCSVTAFSVWWLCSSRWKLMFSFFLGKWSWIWEFWHWSVICCLITHSYAHIIELIHKNELLFPV